MVTGVLADPYKRVTVAFQRGVSTSSEVQIDHVVALADAWVKGAQRLTRKARTRFANDPLNLLATSGGMNQAKGSGDAATWLPPRKAFRCDYVARQIAVKRTYRLWVTRAEHDAMAAILKSCPDQMLPTVTEVAPPPLQKLAPTSTPSPASPTSTPTPTITTASPGQSTTSGPTTTTAPPSTTATTTPSTTTPSTTATTANGTDPRYGTCAAAKAAGYGPYYRGRDPEYSWYRDADNDGVVCE